MYLQGARFLRLKATAIFVLLVVSLLSLEVSGSFAASSTSFVDASSTVRQAFVAVQNAGKDGGNVSMLVTELNDALALIQKASSENSSNPGQAAIDLNSAITIGGDVQASAAAVAEQGLSARHYRLEISVALALVIVDIALAVYAYGDRVYRRLWLRMYGGHVVRKTG